MQDDLLVARLDERVQALHHRMDALDALVTNGFSRLEERLDRGYVTNRQLALMLQGYVTERSLAKAMLAVVGGTAVATISAILGWLQLKGP